MKYLYLDDIRTPEREGWDVVRNYEEFAAYLEKNFGTRSQPTRVELTVSFDHDLADTHYVPEELWNNYSASVKYQDAQEHTEKTGLDCAKLLAEMNLIPASSNSHSMNPVGQANICGFIDGWVRFNNIDGRCGYQNIPFKEIK